MSWVQILALAARTPVGLRAEPTAAAIRAAISRLTSHPVFVDASGEPITCGCDARLPRATPVAERMEGLAVAALQELMEKLALPSGGPAQVPVLLSLPEPRPGFDAGAGAALIRSLAARLASLGLVIEAVGSGHAGVADAAARAVSRIEQRRGSELVIVGGVDSYIDGYTLDWLEESRRLACLLGRGGFPPGEGAAFIALASDGLRRQLRLPSLAVLRAVACANEQRSDDSDVGLLGEGLTVSVQGVASELRGVERFEDSYCDINGERTRTDDYGFALLRTGQLFRDTSSYVTPVASVGDQGAATMALGCVLAARSWARGYATGDRALVLGASWGGLRGAILLQRPS